MNKLNNTIDRAIIIPHFLSAKRSRSSSRWGKNSTTAEIKTIPTAPKVVAHYFLYTSKSVETIFIYLKSILCYVGQSHFL
jgi:hypothetical protein